MGIVWVGCVEVVTWWGVEDVRAVGVAVGGVRAVGVGVGTWWGAEGVRGVGAGVGRGRVRMPRSFKHSLTTKIWRMEDRNGGGEREGGREGEENGQADGQQRRERERQTDMDE